MKKYLLAASVISLTLISSSVFADNCPAGSEMKVMRNENGTFKITGIPDNYSLAQSLDLKETDVVIFREIIIHSDKGYPYRTNHGRNFDIISTEDIRCHYSLDYDTQYHFTITKNNSKGFGYKLGTGLDDWREYYFKPDGYFVSCRDNNPSNYCSPSFEMIKNRD